MGHMGLSIGYYVDDTLIYSATGCIACNTERCIRYRRSVRLSVLPSFRPSVRCVRCFVQSNKDTIMRSSVLGSTMILVSGDVNFIRIFARRIANISSKQQIIKFVHQKLIVRSASVRLCNILCFGYSCSKNTLYTFYPTNSNIRVSCTALIRQFTVNCQHEPKSGDSVVTGSVPESR